MVACEFTYIGSNPIIYPIYIFFFKYNYSLLGEIGRHDRLKICSLLVQVQ